MTIHRTPRPADVYDGTRWVKHIGREVASPLVGRRDFSDRIEAARLAVEARRNLGWPGPVVVTIQADGMRILRDHCEVTEIDSERGRAIVYPGTLNPRRVDQADLNIRVRRS
jgi:hypothetical protein